MVVENYFSFDILKREQNLLTLVKDWSNILHINICIHLFHYRQPEGCLQYHTTLTGRFQTFNFEESTNPVHLANQEYVVCINKTDFFSYLQGYTILPDNCLKTA